MFLELKLEGYTTLEDILIRSMPLSMPKILVKFYFWLALIPKYILKLYYMNSMISKLIIKIYIFFSIEMDMIKLLSES